MMTLKTGVKSFGDSVQKIQGNSETRTKNTSAAEWKKTMGDVSLGDHLNKLSDANWVDPAKKMRTTGNSDMDRDAFFKLMIEQMKRQDPTNPLKSHEMAAQLAQFSSIEQLSNINTTLSELKEQQNPGVQFQALQFIGKAVSGDSASMSRFEGDSNHDFLFDLPADAGSIKIDVRNEQGETVRSFSMKNLKSGKNEITWNGLNESGTAARPGQYRFIVDAKDVQGKKLAVKTDFSGKITGVNFTKDGSVLMIGNKSVKLKDVKTIVDPSVNNNDQKIRSVNTLDLQSQNVKGDNGVKVARAPAAKSLGNMGSVKMSGDMLNRLAREKSGANN